MRSRSGPLKHQDTGRNIETFVCAPFIGCEQETRPINCTTLFGRSKVSKSSDCKLLGKKDASGGEGAFASVWAGQFISQYELTIWAHRRILLLSIGGYPLGDRSRRLRIKYILSARSEVRWTNRSASLFLKATWPTWGKLISSYKVINNFLFSKTSKEHKNQTSFCLSPASSFTSRFYWVEPLCFQLAGFHFN